MVRGCALALSIAVLAACGVDGKQRASCPVSKPRHLNAEVGPGLGNGPVYPVGFDEHSVVNIVLPPPATTVFRGSDWGGDKTIWAIEPGAKGPFTVRGVRLDAPGEVRFDDGKNPPPRKELGNAFAQRWTYGTGYTRIRAHGCYAFIVEGPGFRERIVFRAGLRSDY
jgi:hypothetical protein